jgi:hypothetical protein
MDSGWKLYFIEIEPCQGDKALELDLPQMFSALLKKMHILYVYFSSNWKPEIRSFGFLPVQEFYILLFIGKQFSMVLKRQTSFPQEN